MDRGARHRTLARIAWYTGPLAVHARPAPGRADLAQRLSRTLADRRLHRRSRIALRTRRGERREPWPVADQRRRAPVGERVAAYLELAVQRADRVPDQRRRKGLVGMEYGRPVLDVPGQKNGAPKGSTEHDTRSDCTA